MKSSLRSQCPRFLLASALALGSTGCSDSTGPQYVATLDLAPASAFLTPGESVTLGVAVVGPAGEEMSERAHRIEWSIGDTAVAKLEVLETGAVITAKVLGKTSVTAELGRGVTTVPVYVQPAHPASVVISPSSIEVPLGGGRGVSARIYDADGVQMSTGPYHIQWTVGNTDMASLLYKDATPTVVYGRQRGTTSLRVNIGGQSTSIQVTIY